ncbi:hypothetical protein BDF19DRAFT_422886 [Syncephalis fuscata]|nr:hypothetical protein BDF19DRAFT_422886 [Syncephalis fuscata]
MIHPHHGSYNLSCPYGDYTVRCSYATSCQKEDVAAFVEHLVTHSSRSSSDKLTCPYPSCTYATKKKFCLKSHLSRKTCRTYGLKPYLCGHLGCPMRTPKKSEILRHRKKCKFPPSSLNSAKVDKCNPKDDEPDMTPKPSPLIIPVPYDHAVSGTCTNPLAVSLFTPIDQDTTSIAIVPTPLEDTAHGTSFGSMPDGNTLSITAPDLINFIHSYPAYMNYQYFNILLNMEQNGQDTISDELDDLKQDVSKQASAKHSANKSDEDLRPCSLAEQNLTTSNYWSTLDRTKDLASEPELPSTADRTYATPLSTQPPEFELFSSLDFNFEVPDYSHGF